MGWMFETEDREWTQMTGWCRAGCGISGDALGGGWS